MQILDELPQSRRRIERGMAGMQYVSRGVVDIKKDGVEAPARYLRIETDGAFGHREEVASLQANPWIRRQFGGVGKQQTLMPADDFLERFHHHERMNAGILERRLCGVAEPQSPDDDVELGIGGLSQPEARERYLSHREQARHQELVAELDLVHVDLEHRLDSPAQADDPHAGLRPVENLEACTHDAPPTPPAISLTESNPARESYNQWANAHWG